MTTLCLIITKKNDMKLPDSIDKSKINGYIKAG